jgi:hypothetical protein
MTPELVKEYQDKVATTSVEVEIGGTSGTYALPDDSILRDKRILGFFVMPNESGTAKSPMNRPLASEAAVNSSYLTLKFVNDDVISSHPLSDFRTNKDDRTLRRWDICGLNPSKSYIKVGDTSLIAAGQSIILQFVYFNA